VGDIFTGAEAILTGLARPLQSTENARD
jgi:hypothetical protein